MGEALGYRPGEPSHFIYVTRIGELVHRSPSSAAGQQQNEGHRHSVQLLIVSFGFTRSHIDRQ